MVWRSREKSEDRGWRERFRARLKGNWTDIVLKSIRRPSESEREDVCYWLSQTGNDPLLFLNLAGVSPLTLLDEFDYWKKRIIVLEKLRTGVRSNSQQRADARLLEKAALVLDYWRPLIFPYIRELNHSFAVAPRYRGLSVPKDYPPGQYLKAVAQIIRDIEKLSLVPPGTQKKGGPNVDLSLLVQSLVEICKGEMEARRKGLVGYPEETEPREEIKPYINAGKRALLGLLTALLIAGFPEWFERQRNPVRNVKNAYKAKRESYL